MMNDKSHYDIRDNEASGREIIEAIVEAMTAGLEEFYTKTLAPGLFQIYLHHSDYERLEGLFNELKEDACIALDQRLEWLNRSKRRGVIPFLGRIYRKIGPFLNQVPEEFRPSLTGRVARVRLVTRPRTGWQFSFNRNEDPETTSGDIVIDAILMLSTRQEPGAGLTTKSIRTLFRAGRTEKMPPPPLILDTSVETLRQTTPAAAPVHALIRYRDSKGENSYEMKRNSIVIGRGGTGVWTDIMLDTIPGVSREHIRIKWVNGQFYLKDLSTLGTTVDGVPIPGSMVRTVNGYIDSDTWVRLTSPARISLAGVLELEFIACKEPR